MLKQSRALWSVQPWACLCWPIGHHPITRFHYHLATSVNSNVVSGLLKGLTPPLDATSSSKTGMATAGAAGALATQQAVQKLVEAVQAGSIPQFKSASKALGGQADSVLAVRDNMGRGMLHYAAQFGQVNMIEHLLQQVKFNVNDQDHSGETPLALAAATGKLSAVEKLLAEGADPSLRKDDTATAPVHRAATAGDPTGSEAHPVLLTLLKDNRVSVDTSSKTGTPLCWAAGAGHAAAVQLLLAQGADVNASGCGDDPMPALSLAAGAGSAACVEALLAAGADVKAPGRGGATALHVASAARGKEAVAVSLVQQLLKAGADANAKDAAGFTALEVSVGSGNLDVAALLLPLTQPFPGLASWDLKSVVSHVEKVLEAKAAEARQEAGGAVKPGQHVVAVPEPEDPSPEKAASWKRKGDEAFVGLDNQAAVEAYTQSLKHDTSNAIVWANRAAAYLRLGKAAEALSDARTSRAIDAQYAKAWYREGAAHELLQQWEDAAAAFYEGCSLAPGNQEFEAAFKRAIEAGRRQHQARQRQ